MKITGLLISLLFASFFAVSCHNANKGNDSSSNLELTEDTTDVEVPYVVGQNYFVKNTVQDSVLTLTLTSQEDFDKYFGMAVTMAEDGKPTPIDFEKQVVITFIDKVSDKSVGITPQSLNLENDKINLQYKIETDTIARSFTSRAFLLLIVDKEYGENVEFSEVSEK
ncbi:MAG: hypothetical protein ACLVKO_10100 [Dysgonomonas sp.]